MSRLAAHGIVAVGLCACAPADDRNDIDARAWTPPRAATDLDPDPDVVEIDLVAEVATVEFVPGIATEVWAYRDAGDPSASASVPGPLIEVPLGARLIVHLRNELPEGTTLHWHGLRVPEAMDGNPMNNGSISAGDETTVDFVVRDPGLHWYHSHLYADEQVQRGLQGQVVVRGGDEPVADLERVLALDDIELDDDGAVDLEVGPSDLMLGRRGNTLLVNGRLPAATPATPGTVERWRIVNTSNGRHFALELGGLPMTVVGLDTGPVAEPATTAQLIVAPGERYDVLVAIEGERGDRVALRTLAYDRGGGMEDPGPYTLLEFELDTPSHRRSELSAPPRVVERLAVELDATVRTFELGHAPGPADGGVFTINGKRWPLAPPIHARLGDTEVWDVVNDTDHAHPFHLHGVPFQVVDRDGVAEATLGWKDTVGVGPRGTTRIAVRLDAPGMWMFHCTIPEHAERGMMADVHVMEAE